MRFRQFITGLALSVLLMPVAVARATEAEMILDRRADEMSIYVSMPAPALEEVFGQGAEALLGDDGTVDIDRLYDGTYLAADDIFKGVRLRIDGEDVPVEALSMMLHDPAYLPGFADPIDGQVSIAVCTSPETVRGMTLPELRAYMGFFAWKVDGHAAVEIVFPATGRSDLTVRLRDFVDFRDFGSQVVTLTDGGAIRVAPATELATKSPVESWLAGAGLGLLAMAIGFWAVRRAGRRHVEPT